MRQKKEVIILLLVVVMLFFSGCGTEVSEQKVVEMPNKYTLDVVARYEITETHQAKQIFSIKNTGTRTATNVGVEVYLLAPDQNVSLKISNYFGHKQLTIGTINSGEKTKEYSIVVGEENPASDYEAYLYVKATSAEGNEGSATSDAFSFFAYSSNEFYQETYCKKIDPYNIEVKKAATEAIKDHPGEYSVDQLLDIYDWVKKNVQYLNVPVSLPATPYSPQETLAAKSGDCKNQAVLIASMVESIGGTAEVVGQPSCEHAYAIVYFAKKTSDLQVSIDQISDHYFPCKGGFICDKRCWSYPSDAGAWCDGFSAGQSDKCQVGEVGFTDNMCHWCDGEKSTLVLNRDGTYECLDWGSFSVNWFDHEDGKWLIFDTAGGFYPGDTLPACAADEKAERYFMYSCVKQ
jgi:hypothetical protein